MPLPQRKSPRLHGYDYSQTNYYYVTLCTKDKIPLFGKPEHLNEFGLIAREELMAISGRYQDVKTDAFVVMPNHIHAILKIGCDKTKGDNPTLSSVVAAYKAGVSRRIHKIDPVVDVWQKSFYDEIIRNEQHYQSVWTYIVGNPQK